MTPIDAFLAAAGWQAAQRRTLAGDASARRYERLFRGRDTAVLMIAPPGDEMLRFRRVDEWLLAQGFSAPQILAFDAAAGLMLLEDFGDDLVARLLSRAPAQEPVFYAAITDFLLDLHRLPAPDFAPPLDAAALGALVQLTVDRYPKRPGNTASELPDLVTAACAALEPLAPVLSLRDFHAENVIWLPGRPGSARLGLLDFQDAVSTHPAYDLVSAFQDARHEVSAQLEAQELHRYVAARDLDMASFGAAYAAIGAQRALRILGAFARLCLVSGKAQYLALMPRVWNYLQRNLEHPALASLRLAVHSALEPPEAPMLDRMKQECGKHPTH